MRRAPHLVSAAAVALAGSVVLSSGGPARASSCMPVPGTIPGASLFASGGSPRVRVGAVVYVVRVEPEKYNGRGYPAAFPWLGATSTDRRVLASVRLCPPGASTLRVTVAAFRAVRPGRSTIVAPLAPAWAARRTGLHRFRAVVTVVG
jgi:hypothetical protein